MNARYIITFLLLLALLVQTFYQSAIRLSYYANTTAYAKDCINKSRPMLHCNGKCQMMKKIREQEQKEKDLPERKSGKEEVLSCWSYFATLPPARVTLTQKLYPRLTATIIHQYTTAVFHPPSLA